MKFKNKTILFFFLNILFLDLIAQFNPQDERDDLFIIPRVGFGIQYGGIGTGLEIGAKYFGAYFAYGYQYSFDVKQHTVKESYNLNYGLNYYFKDGNDRFRLKTSLNLGWIENYYEPQLLDNKYDSHIKGITFNFGGEIYFKKLFMEIGLTLGHGKLAFKGDHPYYARKTFISPFIGILYKFPSIEIGEKQELDPKTSKKRCLAISDAFFNNLEKNGMQSYLYSCGKLKVAYELPNSKTMIIVFDIDSTDYYGDCITTLIGNKKTKYLTIYIFDGSAIDNINKTCDDIYLEELKESKNHFTCTKGKAFVYFEKVKSKRWFSKKKLVSVSFKFSDIKFENKNNEELYFDEIIIWNVKTNN
ncbi:MAG: hypothetical protein A2X12_05080 [Bacteroidetes bacterium GWE2_29_8]|nr:MAG: hypothetical protein A2X12_05080 [Bacteroidetes bacterium GWE2_29_8]